MLLLLTIMLQTIFGKSRKTFFASRTHAGDVNYSICKKCFTLCVAICNMCSRS